MDILKRIHGIPDTGVSQLFGVPDAGLRISGVPDTAELRIPSFLDTRNSFFYCFLNFRPICLHFGNQGSVNPRCLWRQGFMNPRCPGRQGVENFQFPGCQGVELILSVHCFLKLQPTATAFKQQSIKKQCESTIYYTNTFGSCIKIFLTSIFSDRFPGFPDSGNLFKSALTLWKSKKISCSSPFKGSKTSTDGTGPC